MDRNHRCSPYYYQHSLVEYYLPSWTLSHDTPIHHWLPSKRHFIHIVHLQCHITHQWYVIHYSFSHPHCLLTLQKSQLIRISALCCSKYLHHGHRQNRLHRSQTFMVHWPNTSTSMEMWVYLWISQRTLLDHSYSSLSILRRYIRNRTVSTLSFRTTLFSCSCTFLKTLPGLSYSRSDSE